MRGVFPAAIFYPRFALRMYDRPPVLLVNSLVSRGSVGGRAGLFALQRMGIPVVFLPTVLLPWHPGHGPGTRIAVEPSLIADIAGSLAPGAASACLTGYFGTRGQVDAAIDLVANLRVAAPTAPVLCDPVVGDAGHFYIGAGIRDRVRALAAVADIVTPNRFEIAFLAGRDPAQLVDNAALTEAAHSLGRPEVIVTSAFADEGETANLLVTPDQAALVVHRAFAYAPHGTGDILAALYLGHRLDGDDPVEALTRAAAATVRLVELAGNADELPLAAGQGEFLAPPLGVRVVRLDGG
ncbi:MAG: bifunctional hydroxymethylpyrimidine kinase/phosphomethylpyrimidine kinase [Bauldia sp.]|nr:bifunctional hydroxymethylpyrimidine kinase/phosphomethylpyrimidine kinase [Bauldia sp.]